MAAFTQRIETLRPVTAERERKVKQDSDAEIESLKENLNHSKAQAKETLHSLEVNTVLLKLRAAADAASTAAKMLLQLRSADHDGLGAGCDSLHDALQQATPQISRMAPQVPELLQSLWKTVQLNSKMVTQQRARKGKQQTGSNWTPDMQATLQGAHNKCRSFPDIFGNLMQCMSKLAAFGRCRAATRIASQAAFAEAASVLDHFDGCIKQLHDNMLSRDSTGSLCQSYSEVQRLQGITAKVLDYKKKRFRLLQEAHSLLAAPAIAHSNPAEGVSAALLSVSSQQHGMVIITDVGGTCAVSSSRTTVDFGMVLSNTGSVLRTICLVNNSTTAAHVTVSSCLLGHCSRGC